MRNYQIRRHMCKVIIFVIVIIVMLLSICNVKPTSSNNTNVQAISIIVADDNNTTITYANKEIQSSTGQLYITNKSKFSIELFLCKQNRGTSAIDSDAESVKKLKANETYSIDEIEKNIPYEIGCRADVDSGTMINLSIKDSQSKKYPD